jgi:hypothetical protein
MKIPFINRVGVPDPMLAERNFEGKPRIALGAIDPGFSSGPNKDERDVCDRVPLKAGCAYR